MSVDSAPARNSSPAAAPAVPDQADPDTRAGFEHALAEHRVELTAYCYRMLGSGFDAEDAVQETMVRAWRGHARFEGRSSLRSWLYRIATNVCLDQISARKRRALPMDLEAPGRPMVEHLSAPLPESTWVLPAPDDRLLPATEDPADVVAARESVQLAFVAALQHLPARQRAVLVLRDVLRWSAAEVATLLDATTATVNSLLQRARATLEKVRADPVPLSAPDDAEEQRLLERYVAAFEAYDIETLVTLLHEDASQTMPPYSLWLTGAADIAAWMRGPGIECRGSRLLPLRANATPGFAHYRPSGPQGEHQPWAVCLVETDRGRITGLRYFLAALDPRLFALFGMPQTPPPHHPAEKTPRAR